MMGRLYRRYVVRSGDTVRIVRGILAPVRREASLYARFASAGVGGPRPVLVRYFGEAMRARDGASYLEDADRRYLVLEDRVVSVCGKTYSDAVLEQLA